MFKIKSNFIFNYCCTCHSCQGSSIDDSITIFDYNFKYVNREWLYVAITRATDLSQVYFYNYKEDTKVSNTCIASYFQKKVLQYMKQDKEANRNIERESYITVTWLKNCINRYCHNCHSDFYINVDDNGMVKSNITADRINNSEGHNLDNIQPCCYYCNCSLSNKAKV